MGRATPNLRFSNSTLWLHTTVHNRDSLAVKLFLHIPYAKLDRVTLHVVRVPQYVQTLETGDRMPARERPYAAVGLVLPFSLDSGESVELFLRVSSRAGPLIVPVDFLTETALREHARDEMLLFGSIVGLFAALLVYELVLLARHRDSAYLLYVVYLLIVFFTISAINGVGPALFYPGNTWIGNEGVPLLTGLTLLTSFLFARAFFRSREIPDVDFWFRLLVGASAVLCLLAFTLPVQQAYQAAVVTAVLFPLFGAAAGIYAWLHGRVEARFYILGQFGSLIGLIVFGLMIVGYFRYSLLVFEAVAIGLCFDITMMAIALADRARQRQCRAPVPIVPASTLP